MDLSLLNANVIYFSPTMAGKVGISPAIFIQHLNNFNSNPSVVFQKDGKVWVRKNMDALKDELFFSEKEIQTIIRTLKRRKVLLVDGDSYSIDHDVLESLPGKRR